MLNTFYELNPGSIALPVEKFNGNPVVLVTGASGFVGSRLVPQLLLRGYNVRIMIRGNVAVYKKKWPEVEIAVADALDPGALNNALKGVHTAFYLIHSLEKGKKQFESADIKIASNFINLCDKNKVNRIIYLCGLGRQDSKLSPHLDNRLKVGSILKSGKTPVTILRACMIIGKGSASYEILKGLVDNIPVFFYPKVGKNQKPAYCYFRYS